MCCKKRDKHSNKGLFPSATNKGARFECCVVKVALWLGALERDRYPRVSEATDRFSLSDLEPHDCVEVGVSQS
jgi:hypothetical protein